ncbi:glycosyltransferase [Metallosphaera tengchongensis]|uniref:glycosyltransferase n=1 Tax=Metallosphaera tengchongensis TaxID=1532350 RepID=UPI001FEA8FA5|nr:glycosyltransferase [Metallosphaera tengchongensis]
MFTSKLEDYTLTPLEAMACGTPVAITDNAGSRAYAVNGYNALIDDTQSPGGWQN